MATSANSLETGRAAATHLRASLGGRPHLVITYLTVNHDQQSYLRGVREVLGAETPIIGCSGQGLIGVGRVREDGFAAGALGLGGDTIEVHHAMAEDIARDTAAKAKQLGRELCRGLGTTPRVVLLNYDALSGVNIELFLDELFDQVGCVIVGGAAAHAFFYEELQRTYQYCDDRVVSGAAVACAFSGQFGIEVDACHGCSPVGVELTVTRAQGNVLLELDGRRAIDVWRDICGVEFRESTALAVGIPAVGATNMSEFTVRAAYRVDEETGGVMLGTAAPVGKRIMLHHRSTDDVLNGARQMGQNLRNRLGGRDVRAVLGFECGSRTRPFLGDEATLQENLDLQRAVGEHAAWLGVMAWGEVFPVAGRPTFHNYSYPLLVFVD